MTLTYQGGPLALDNVLLRPSFQKFAVVFNDSTPAAATYAEIIMRSDTCYSLPGLAKTYLALALIPMADRVRLIAEERLRQINKFGDQSFRTDDQWLHILLEEVGEVSKEYCEIMFLHEEINKVGWDNAQHSVIVGTMKDQIDIHRANIVKESVQVAAVACAWFEAIYQRKK